MPTRWYQRTDSAAVPRLRGWMIILAVLALLLIGQFWGRSALPRWLRVDEAPVAADAIVVLGGGDGSREERGVELYRQGLAPVLISSGEKLHLPGIDETFAAVSANYMIALGVPRDSVIRLDTATSTYDEAVLTLALARDRGWRTLLVTTDAFHTRRAYLTFQKVYAGSGVQVVLVAADPDWYQPDRWWRDERSSIAIFEECVKLVRYRLSGQL